MAQILRGVCIEANLLLDEILTHVHPRFSTRSTVIQSYLKSISPSFE